MENSGDRFTLPNGQTVARIEVFYIAKLLQIGSIVGAVVCLITVTWSGQQWTAGQIDTLATLYDILRRLLEEGILNLSFCLSHKRSFLR
jgi:hypothetical protein